MRLDVGFAAAVCEMTTGLLEHPERCCQKRARLGMLLSENWDLNLEMCGNTHVGQTAHGLRNEIIEELIS